MSTTGTVNIGLIGLGARAENLLVSLFAMDDVAVTAICDVAPAPLERIKGIVTSQGRPCPVAVQDYRALLERSDVDAVLVPTSWNSHLPIAAAAMRRGKYAGIEVGGASSTEELWQLVHAHEESGAHCMMLENICYARTELMILNLVRQGLFGEIIHCTGGYEHDLRDTVALKVEEGFERSLHNRYRNGDLYPTHQLGPIAKILRINRGNRFLSLTSTASKARGNARMAEDHFGPGTDRGRTRFNKGDVVTTVIRCAEGETITLTHSVSLPRPYSRNGRVQGTRGLWVEDTNGIYIDGVSPSIEEIDPAGLPYTTNQWDPVESFYEQYDHPLWKESKDNIIGGHGGADYHALMAFINAVRQRTAPPIDVYDCAAWMSVTCLSEQSIALGSAPVAFPEFTGGKWVDREPEPKSKWSLDAIHSACFAT